MENSDRDIDHVFSFSLVEWDDEEKNWLFPNPYPVEIPTPGDIHNITGNTYIYTSLRGCLYGYLDLGSLVGSAYVHIASTCFNSFCWWYWGGTFIRVTGYSVCWVRLYPRGHAGCASGSSGRGKCGHQNFSDSPTASPTTCRETTSCGHLRNQWNHCQVVSCRKTTTCDPIITTICTSSQILWDWEVHSNITAQIILR